MTSGYMWTQIRHPPYAQPSQHGVNYFAPGYQNQLGAETHIVACICESALASVATRADLCSADGVLAFAVYTLAVTLPEVKNPAKQRIGVYVWLAILFVMFSVLLSIFGGQKQQGYPFRLLF